MRPIKTLSAFALAALLTPLAACDEGPPPVVPPPTATPPVQQPPPSGPPAITGFTSVDAAAMDPSAKPCDDFYQYACGGWMKATTIPSDEASWTRSFDVIQQTNEKVLREILESDAKSPTAGDPYSRELGDFYTACMDEAGVEKADLTPLQPMLKLIDGMKNAKDLAKVLATLHKAGIVGLFGFDSGQDYKDATQVIGVLEQGGLGLPERDYYLKDDPKSKDIVAKYEAHVAKMLTLVGSKEADAKKDAHAVLALETALARASLPRVEMRDPQKIYHRLDRSGLVQAAPSFPWAEYFAALGAASVEAINVAEPEFVKGVDVVMNASPSLDCPKPKGDAKKDAAKKDDGKKDVGAPPSSILACPNQPKKFPVADIKPYLRYHAAYSLARTLPKRVADERFALEHVLTGTETQPPRWKQCVRLADFAFGEALAQPFVKKMLGEEGKANTRHMVQMLEDVMKDNLGKLAWMDDSTRKNAIGKLAAIANKIAFPDKWRSYDGLVVSRTDPLTNRVRAFEFEGKRRLAKIGKPLDRTEWEITPPTVNAYYEPTMNEIVFPAGILQAPFYANSASMGANYGAIGSVIGHELTHAFDDEGSQFDAKGNLSNWWAPNVRGEFDRRADCVVKQFDGFAVGDMHENGKLTLGENIADLGGLRIAYAAFRRDRMATGKSYAGDFNDDQQFFLSFAQAWCTNMRDEFARRLAMTDPHALPRFRIDGPLSNLKEFSDAFSCQPGSKMVSAQRCEVW